MLDASPAPLRCSSYGNVIWWWSNPRNSHSNINVPFSNMLQSMTIFWFSSPPFRREHWIISNHHSSFWVIPNKCCGHTCEHHSDYWDRRTHKSAGHVCCKRGVAHCRWKITLSYLLSFCNMSYKYINLISANTYTHTFTYSSSINMGESIKLNTFREAKKVRERGDERDAINTNTTPIMCLWT